MAKEPLIVELDARTKKLDAKLISTNEKLDKLSGKTEKADTKLKTLSNSASILGKSIGVAAVAVTALTAGTVALINKTTEYSKKIKIASKLSGVHSEQLQKMAFATNTVGIDVEKLGDIFKDSREKIGDFLNTGGGGFQDFADAMKLTKDEAKKAAEEFSHLSGPEILQEMVTRMEEADVSFVQMSHALEGMASDTTNLIPLLSDSGKEMKNLSDAMADVTVPLTDDDLQKLEDLDIALKLAAESATSLATQTLVDLSDWFINAANAASFFFSTLNEGSRADLQTDLLSTLKDIEGIEARLGGFMLFESIERPKLEGILSELIVERDRIEEALSVLDSELTAPKLVKTKIGGGEDDESGSVGGTGDQIQAIADRFKDEETLLLEKLNRELEIIGDNNSLKLELNDEFLAAIVAMDQAAEDEKARIKTDALEAEQKEKDKQAKKDAKIAKVKDKNAKDSAKLEDQQAKASMALAAVVFQDNKEVSAGIAFVNTAQGVTKALAVQDYAGAALTGILGAAQISAILGAGRGGGSAPSVSSSAPSTQQESNFVPDTSSIELTESTGTGSSEIRVVMVDGSGNDLVTFISEQQSENQRNGRG